MTEQVYSIIPHKCKCEGIWGWMLADLVPNCEHYEDTMFVTGFGFGIAHDIMEHEDLSKIGDCTDEVYALGTLYYLRSCDLGNKLMDPITGLGYEVCNVLRHLYWRLMSDLEEVDVVPEKWAIKAAARAAQTLIGENVFSGRDTAADVSWLRRQQRAAARLLTVGYGKGEARYPDRTDPYYTFGLISDELNRVFRDHKAENAYMNGQSLKLTFDIEYADVRVELVEPEYEYEDEEDDYDD